MKAIVYTKYGPPEVLQLKEIEKPVPKGNEILVKVHATRVGPSDIAFRKADPFTVRFVNGFFKPKISIPGSAFSGEIEAVGKSVQSFKVGNPVFGTTVLNMGCCAEYIIISEDKAVAIKPVNMSFEEAAGICDGGNTALTFLRDTAKLRKGQKVLVNGASGSVGIFAVQLARYFGAEVTGVCSTANVDFVKSLGANRVIDYTNEDFTKREEMWDVIFDAAGKSSFKQCKQSLTKNGIYLLTNPTPAIMMQMLWTSKVGSKKAIFIASGMTQKKEKMNFLKELIEAGKLIMVIDRCYPLEEISDAHRYVEKGHKKGDVVITINKSNTNSSQN